MSKKQIELNIAQLYLVTAKQRIKVLEGGRGIGKSTILAYQIKEVITQMPRSYNVIVGETYMQILTRTLPSTIFGLEMFGLIKEQHFVVGERGPKHWPEPYTPPLNYKHVIHFYTGAVYVLVSQDRPGSGRGQNVDSILGDEAALLDGEMLYNDVILTNRGNLHRYKTHLHHSVLFTSTTPMSKKGRWMFDYEKQARSNPDEYFYLLAPATVNIHNLGQRYFVEAKRAAPSKIHYEAEILSIRPPSIANGFYPTLTKDHYYYAHSETYFGSIDSKVESVDCRIDTDLDPTLPLCVGIDWGTFNSMVVFQVKGKTIHVLKSFWVQNPRILDDMIKEDFLPYYRHHKTKRIYMYYDRNGNARRPAARTTLAEHAQQLFEKGGWSVIRKTTGLDAKHDEKYHLIARAFKEDDARLPKIRINKPNNQDLIVSLENAEARESTGQIKKDKRSEQRKTVKQQHATHLSDAFDVFIVPKCKEALRGRASFVDMTLLG